MLDILGPSLQNILSPVILFFVLGLLAAALRSDLEIPPAIAKGLTLFLMAAIGFRGGLELSHGPWEAQVLVVALTAIALSFAMPLLAYALLRGTTELSKLDAVALAAAFGSVSLVTFAAATAFLERLGVPYHGWFVTILAIMETPAILVGLVLARRVAPGVQPLSMRAIVREALVSGSVLVLLGSLLIGLVTGERGAASVGPVLIGGFQGILAFFLLEMGLLVAKRLREQRAFSWRVAAFGLLMPLVGAAIGLAAAWLLGLDAGDGTLLAVLVGSASYIAVPAAFRHALPEANPAVYVTLPLAVTFPFNLLIGIPVYHAAAQAILGG